LQRYRTLCRTFNLPFDHNFLGHTRDVQKQFVRVRWPEFDQSRLGDAVEFQTHIAEPVYRPDQRREM
jgi:hypothetical protein